MDCIILETTPETKQGRDHNAERINRGGIRDSAKSEKKKERKKESNRAGGVLMICFR